MDILSVINYKGGVGKTTLTANIAANLAMKGKRVLIIDLDPQTNLTLSFITIEEWGNYSLQRKTIKHWYDQYIEGQPDTSIKDLIIEPNNINNKVQSLLNKGCIHLIASHFDLINIDIDLSMKLCGYTPREQKQNYLNLYSRLKKGLDDVKDDYDLILIDCPPNFNVITRNAIVASEGYIVPVKADYLSTLGIDQLERHVANLTNEYNAHLGTELTTHHIHPQLLGIIFTMVEHKKKGPIDAQKEYISKVKNQQHPIFTSYLRTNNTLFSGAPETGVPALLQHSTKSQTTINELKTEIEAITKELLSKLK